MEIIPDSLLFILKVLIAGIVMVHLAGGLGTVVFRRLTRTRSLRDAVLILLGAAVGELLILTPVFAFSISADPEAFNQFLGVLTERAETPLKLVGAAAMIGLVVFLLRRGVPDEQAPVPPKGRAPWWAGFYTSVSTGGFALNSAVLIALGIMPITITQAIAIYILAPIGGIAFWGSLLYTAERTGRLHSWAKRLYYGTMTVASLVALYLIGSVII